jgi:hypothetical protein
MHITEIAAPPPRQLHGLIAMPEYRQAPQQKELEHANGCDSEYSSRDLGLPQCRADGLGYEQLAKGIRAAQPVAMLLSNWSTRAAVPL